MTGVSAVIVNWNRFKDTVECVDSLQRGSLTCSKIIVVDNGSSDGSAKRLKGRFDGDESIVVVECSQNKGFAAGVNRGIQEAFHGSDDYIFLMNNDATVDPDCLLTLVSAMQSDDKLGLAGPCILYHHKTEKIWQGGGYYRVLRAGVQVPDKSRKWGEVSKSTQEVTFLSGCTQLIKSDLLRKVGTFDEDYFMYSEDLDLCLRAHRGGFRLLYVPSAKSFHKISDEGGARASEFTLYHLARGILLLHRKFFSLPYRLYGALIQALLYTPVRILQTLRSGAGLVAIKGWFLGLWDGFHGKPARLVQ